MELQKITARKLLEKLQNNEELTVIDVRAEEKYREFHIEGPQIESRNIPKFVIFELDEAGDHFILPKDKEMVITCTTGNSAAKCAEILQNHGYKVTVLDGGLTAWNNCLDEGVSTHG